MCEINSILNLQWLKSLVQLLSDSKIISVSDQLSSGTDYQEFGSLQYYSAYL